MIDRYLMSVAEADAQLDEDFSERVCELLNDEWNPDLFKNMSEAFANDCLYPHKESLEFAMKHNDFAEYGLIIFKAVEEYCISQAEDQANYEFSKGLN